MSTDDILDLEESEISGYLDAIEVLELTRQLQAMTAALLPRMPGDKLRSMVNSLAMRKEMLLGRNPFEPSQKQIDATTEKLKRQADEWAKQNASK